jgi:hypothetical protein
MSGAAVTPSPTGPSCSVVIDVGIRFGQKGRAWAQCCFADGGGSSFPPLPPVMPQSTEVGSLFLVVRCGVVGNRWDVRW